MTPNDIDWAEVARHRAAGRKREPKTCAVCGRGFVGIKTARYCSNACRQKAKRQRQTTSPKRGRTHGNDPQP